MVSFAPPARLLLGPGPSPVHPRVLAALSRPTIGHLDPEFLRLMDDIRRHLQRLFRSDNAVTFPVSGPGSAGMEIVLVNLIEPGDTVIVCRNGVFGGRMAEVAERCGADVVIVDDPWGRAVDPQKLRAALRAHPEAKLVAFVHAETSTGALSDAATLCSLAREHGCLTVVDAVTSLGGVPLEVDAWGIDAVYSGTQKCLSCPPGLAPVSFSERAVEAVRGRRHKVRSWFLDLGLLLGYWNGETRRSYHHTAPINMLYALHEALALLEREGLERAWTRHARVQRMLHTGLAALGLELLVPERERMPQLGTVLVPEDIADEAEVRRRLLEQHGIEIGAGLGTLAGRVWRVGLMGHGARPRNVTRLLGALETSLAFARRRPADASVAVDCTASAGA